MSESTGSEAVMPAINAHLAAELIVEGETWPVFVWTIDHPAGRVLVDTGMIDVRPEVDDPTALYDRYGFRVPAVIVSPHARPGFVLHDVHDHTSILRVIEQKWNLAPLTARDAGASNLLDALDLTAPPAFVEPPTLPAPALGFAGPPRYDF